jgi:hypothetical protein
MNLATKDFIQYFGENRNKALKLRTLTEMNNEILICLQEGDILKK